MTKLKNKLICALALMIVSVMFIFSGCGLSSDNDTETEAEIYIIMYTDGTKVYTMEVEYGDLWYIENIPTKVGYVFTGYFNAEVGGVQYTSSTGMCLTAYYDKTYLILYPQFVEE